MSLSDPIADMLTRIRNANDAGHPTVEIPASREKQSIIDILVNEGYLEKSEVVGEGIEKRIKVTIKYGESNGDKVITGVRRISKPGLRVYAGTEDLPQVLGGLGIAIVSTNQGVVTDREARKLGVGGEVIAYVW